MFYQLTHGDYSLDDALDMQEIVDVGRSWRTAKLTNVREQQKIAAAKKGPRRRADAR